MKMLVKTLLLTLVLTISNTGYAQTFEESEAALKRRDYATAFAGFKKLALQGNADAQYNLGSMYEYGRGVPKDYQQAMFWYRKPADQGNLPFQFLLGAKYQEGKLVPRDYQQAAFWFRKAADKGDADAQYILAIMYEKGEGVPKDDETAYFWWLLSSVKDQTSEERRDIVEKRLTHQQRTNAQAKARDWKPTK